jgi:hypothetical protein
MLAAAWITAIATVGLLAGAIVTAVYAARAFGKQRDQLADQKNINAKQTAVLELQGSDLRASLAERARETAERRRAQAALVFVWQEQTLEDPHVAEFHAPLGDEQLEHGFEVAHITNASKQPIYDIRISWQAGSSPRTLNRGIPLKPSERIWDSVAMSRQGAAEGSAATVYFRDAAGLIWWTQPDGRFGEVPASDDDSRVGSLSPGGDGL